jgi:hypothetical protein
MVVMFFAGTTIEGRIRQISTGMGAREIHFRKL